LLILLILLIRSSIIINFTTITNNFLVQLEGRSARFFDDSLRLLETEKPGWDIISGHSAILASHLQSTVTERVCRV